MWREILVLWILNLCGAEKVIELNDTTFIDTVTNDAGFWLLYFYAVRLYVNSLPDYFSALVSSLSALQSSS
jgi:hypothetical protein